MMIKLLLLFLVITPTIQAQTIVPVVANLTSQNNHYSEPKQIIGNFPVSLGAVDTHQLTDSLVTGRDAFSKRESIHKFMQKAAIPVILIGFGFAGSGNKPLLSYNGGIQEEIQEHYSGFHTKIENYTRFVPISMAYGLNIAGIQGQHNLVNLTCLYVLSDFISSSATKQLKGFTHQMRPDSSAADAFPSGHTSGAFTGATILFLEYKDKNIWYGIGGYSFAVATGAIRMLNNKHWFSDVLAGAGIGILSTQVAYAVYPWIQKQISRQIPKLSNKNLFITPTYVHSALGFGMVYQLK